MVEPEEENKFPAFISKVSFASSCIKTKSLIHLFIFLAWPKA